MTTNSSRRRGWIIGVGLIALVCAVVGAMWVAGHQSEPSASSEDCSVVEGVGNEWQRMEADVRKAVLDGAGEPSDYLTAANHEAAVADKLRGAAGSVSSQEIEDQLNKWAAGAELFAKVQREAAERKPGTPQADGAQSEYIEASTMANDAVTALGEICPNMPWEEP
jgi:hypothetical protein